MTKDMHGLLSFINDTKVVTTMAVILGTFTSGRIMKVDGQELFNIAILVLSVMYIGIFIGSLIGCYLRKYIDKKEKQ